VFESSTLTVHIVRGIAGIAAVAAASSIAQTHPIYSLPLLAIALFALRGCPMCWTIGLIQMIGAKLRGGSTAGLCNDGRCSRPD
jgi:hypothetical protein